MPKDSTAPLKCRFCRAVGVVVEGGPPNAATAYCDACGESWAVCGAGGRCLQNPLVGKLRCKHHGGASTGPPIKHGRRSKYLPLNLQELVEEALADPDLTSVREDIALVDAMLSDHTQQLEDVTGAAFWRRAQQATARYHDAAADPDGDPEGALGALFGVIDEGAKEAEKVGLVLRLVEQRRKLSETEAKRLGILNQYITAREANVLVAALIAAVNRHVADPSVKGRISAELTGLVSRNALPGAR